MIVLEQDEINTFYLLLQNNYRLVSGTNIYDFKIIDSFNHTSKIIEIEDISLSNIVSEFVITTTSIKNDEDLGLGIVNLKLNKRYIYELSINGVIIDTNFLTVIEK